MVALEQGLRARWRPAAERLYGNWLSQVTTRKGRHAAVTARSPTAAAAGRPAAFVERRRRNDSSGLYGGARDRRVSART